MNQKTILVVDDNPQVRTLIFDILKDSSYRILQATDGKQALTTIKHVKVDVIVLDIVMPEMDGLEVIRELRKDLYAAKIIAISGDGHANGKTYIDAAIMMGADAKLMKPFSSKKLLEAIENVMQ